MTPRNRTALGIDVGSVSVNVVLLAGDGTVLDARYHRCEGRPVAVLAAVFDELAAAHPQVRPAVAVVTGSGKDRVANALGIPAENEVVAHAAAAARLYPHARSIFEIGGQDSKFVELQTSTVGSGRAVGDHQLNELCAAGTGAFLDQQAERLGLSVEELSDLAVRAKRPASIAGRCTVFAKSDMIHLQQIGRPLDEIVAGLCVAVARNYLGLLKGRRPRTPIVFQGGVAANRGVVAAFRKLLRLSEEELFVPEHHRVMGAIGAALLAQETEATAERVEPAKHLRLATLASRLRALRPPAASGQRGRRPRLRRPLSAARQQLPQTDRRPGEEVTLGIDSGSVSTKAVLLNRRGSVVASCYLRTGDDPLAAVRRAFSRLDQDAPDVRIRAVAVTGSGRSLVAETMGADVTLNEISAQAQAAVFHDPDVDTVIEIGGQDAKFIKLENGVVTGFEMNRVCSAGTGAFLEEQAKRLGVQPDIQFSEAAFRSRCPALLGSRCTVFMDTDVVHHQQRGASRDDLLAGLAYSVVENYLEMVVGQLSCGERVVFHGGVAKNEAVVAAFEALLGRPVAVHPLAPLTGAVGVALRAWEHHEESGETRCPTALPGRTRLRSLRPPDLRVEVTTFECNKCANTCEINRLALPAGEVFTGSVCGRFESTSKAGGIVLPDLFAEREDLLLADTGLPGPQPRRRVGLPRALAFHDLYPFFRRFLQEVGYEVVLSEETGKATLAAGAETVPVEVCLPLKVAFGHAATLLQHGADPLFLPSPRHVPDLGGEPVPRTTCPYLQACGSMVRATLGCDVRDPAVPVSEGHISVARLMKSFPELGWLDRKLVPRALRSARRAQRDFREGCRDRGAQVLSEQSLRELPGPAVVILGRPYCTQDRVVCLDLPRRLRNQGVLPIPMDMLPLDEVQLDERWNSLEWGYPRDLLKAATYVRSRHDLAAVLLTSFGCGPDAFVLPYAKDVLGNRPHLDLEMDEHRAAAGLTTRLEAFVDTLSMRRPRRRVREAQPGVKPKRNLRGLTVYLHRSSDHFHAVAGALRGMGVQAQLLPAPDEETLRQGRSLTGGSECHPFVLYAGDLARLRDRPDFKPERSVYFAPSYEGPCLMAQYRSRLEMIARKLGLTGLRFADVVQAGELDDLGTEYHVLLGQGLYAVDRLLRYTVELQAFEVERGACQRAHQHSLLDLESALARGDLLPAVLRSVARLQTIPLDRSRVRVPVGLIGDVYTRVNSFANNGLVDRIIDLGCEVWMPWTIIDHGIYDIWNETRLERTGHYLTSLRNWAVGRFHLMFKHRIDQCFPRDLHCPSADPGKHTYQAVQPLIDPDLDSVLTLNLGRASELADAGVAGILNVICHRCMLGTISSALLRHLRQRAPGLPVATLVLGGLHSTQQLTRLEAFVHQARQFHARRASPSWSRSTGPSPKRSWTARVTAVVSARSRRRPGTAACGSHRGQFPA